MHTSNEYGQGFFWTRLEAIGKIGNRQNGMGCMSGTWGYGSYFFRIENRFKDSK